MMHCVSGQRLKRDRRYALTVAAEAGDRPGRASNAVLRRGKPDERAGDMHGLQPALRLPEQHAWDKVDGPNAPGGVTLSEPSSTRLTPYVARRVPVYLWLTSTSFHPQIRMGGGSPVLSISVSKCQSNVFFTRRRHDMQDIRHSYAEC